MGLVIKAALGALVVLLIGVLAKAKNYYIAGLIPLFPTFALIAHYIVARRFCRFCCVLGDKRMGVDYMLDKAALTQMTTAIKRETASGDKAAGK